MMPFTHIIQSKEEIKAIPVRNLGELFFNKLDHRDERSEVILSHEGNTFIRIILPEFRSILYRLYLDFKEKGIRHGDTVLLASVTGNNECYVALLFAALASYGVRVLLPMFMESADLGQWLDYTRFRSIIYPAREIGSFEHHEKEKSIIKEIHSFAGQHQIPCYDSLADFNLAELILERDAEFDMAQDPLIKEILSRTGETTESLIITTSGSTGKSQLVVYEQGAFIRSSASWQSAGLFEKSHFAGRGFTPLFTHTMGIRSFFNGLWSGHPVCLINTEYFFEKPEVVRYFLIQMKPEHITGGPATFRLLLEMMRSFPEMKKELVPYLKTLISSGASVQSDVIADMESVFDLRIQNAFGTTETQQVLNTILSPDLHPDHAFSMGDPLPGVRLGLEKYNGQDLYRLHIQSPFGCSYVMGKEGKAKRFEGYFYTGDIVSYKDRKIYYSGRESSDFFKDGFGVKVPLFQIKSHYKDLVQSCTHVEFFPLMNEPGLAALIFSPEQNKQKSFKPLIESINNQLFRDMDPFSFRHHTLRRLAIISSAAPMTAKGGVAFQKIKEEFGVLISDLVSEFPVRENIEMLELKEDVCDPYTRSLNQYIGGLLHELKMDVSYHRGQKDSLFTRRGDREVEILDMTGGYGTNLLGHHHPELAEAAIDFLRSGRISLTNQGSIQNQSGRMADRLNLMVGQITGRNYRVNLGSTGAEIVEMALHHACLEWRNRMKRLHDQQSQIFGGHAGSILRQIWSDNFRRIEKCTLHVVVSATGFHGHTSGARSLLSASEKRDAFSNLLPIQPIYVDDRNRDWQSVFEEAQKEAHIQLQRLIYRNGSYETETWEASTIIAAMFEPVIGEGGIRVLDQVFLSYFSRREYPLIMDEIQCGLGRSGTFLASQGVDANYYLFAKALGGGFEKIGALLIDSAHYQKVFDKYYSSTFANGELAALMAHEVIKVIQSDHIPERAEKCGKRLSEKLALVRSEYPDVIQAIKGKGLMQGIYFADYTECDNIVLRLLAKEKMIGYLYASYLLNRHNIRILPSLVAASVLRVEPSVYVTDQEIDHLCQGIRELAGIISRRNIYQLCKHLMDEDEFEDGKGKEALNGYFYQAVDPPARGAVQVTFIGHFAYPIEELRAFDRDFSQASDTGLRILSNRIQRLFEMNPVTLYKKNIFNDLIHFTFTIIPLDSAELERLHREGNRKKLVGKIQKAIDQSVAEGSKVISLGGYTSILTNNGLALSAPDDVRIITGNTLTVASGLRRVLDALMENKWFHKKNVIAIVGIPGNIGTVLCEQMIRRTDLFSEVILVGRTMKQLEHYFDSMHAELDLASSVPVRLETDLKCLALCDVIINSTNTNDPIIFPHHIKKEGKVLISDNSVPAGVSEEVMMLENVINLPFASYIELPYDPDLVVSSHTPQGAVFCCAGEGLLCGLEQVAVPLKGKISNEAVAFMTTLAEKHGFFEGLGGITSFKTGGKK